MHRGQLTRADIDDGVSDGVRMGRRQGTSKGGTNLSSTRAGAEHRVLSGVVVASTLKPPGRRVPPWDTTG